MFKYKKGASPIITLIVLVCVIGSIAISVVASTSNNWGNVNTVAQNAIELKNNQNINVKPINPSDAVDKEHTHDWRLINKEVLSATERKDTFLCYSCGERREDFIEGIFGLPTDVKDGVYNIINSTYTSIDEYIKSNYETNIQYTVKFKYAIIDKPISLSASDLGVRVVFKNFASGTESKSTSISYFTSNTGTISHKFNITDKNIQSSYPTLGFELVSKINTTASIKITDFEVMVEDSIHGHNLSLWTTLQKATCTSDGYRMRNCKLNNCSYNETQIIEKGNHVMHQKILSYPTCLVKGETQNTCLVCGIFDKTVETYGPHNPIYTIVKESKSCQEIGAYSYICSVCNISVSTGNYKMEHNYIETLVSPTCTEKGKLTEVCKQCKDTKVTILDTVHLLEQRRTKPTCIQAAYIEFYCVLCNNVIERSFLYDKNPHNFGFLYSKIEKFGNPTIEQTVYYYECSDCKIEYKINKDLGNSFSDYIK